MPHPDQRPVSPPSMAPRPIILGITLSLPLWAVILTAASALLS